MDPRALEKAYVRSNQKHGHAVEKARSISTTYRTEVSIRMKHDADIAAVEQELEVAKAAHELKSHPELASLRSWLLSELRAGHATLVELTRDLPEVTPVADASVDDAQRYVTDSIERSQQIARRQDELAATAQRLSLVRFAVLAAHKLLLDEWRRRDLPYPATLFDRQAFGGPLNNADIVSAMIADIEERAASTVDIGKAEVKLDRAINDRDHYLDQLKLKEERDQDNSNPAYTMAHGHRSY